MCVLENESQPSWESISHTTLGESAPNASSSPSRKLVFPLVNHRCPSRLIQSSYLPFPQKVA
ncbi:hypothetical protein M430DRAFT_33441 [Amorphotheca resinae ATCC 22711]|uniref:Uncharacterized protein n=1 Tax=Amorphotheca resinae ATCC 22711 TaxID=857342 RepID=A0A2T3BC33_AMORE|nr:hypothetical protein M430DRAFT_33441 [Amorphotheca resinae ATCC 22711]PSS25897.1 hypothetical protein M430DRAFT_33441 [Amorphotheca resinae ATCC 22711]